MPTYALIVEDPEKDRQAEIHRRARSLMADGMPPDIATLRVTPLIRQTRAIGTLHTTTQVDCPDGRPNCRNCGDPAFEASCRAAGHCPECGRTGKNSEGKMWGHGLAPDSVVRAAGLSLIEVAPARQFDVWSAPDRQFVRISREAMQARIDRVKAAEDWQLLTAGVSEEDRRTAFAEREAALWQAWEANEAL